MKKYTLFIYSIVLTWLASCVDRFEADLPQSAMRVLAVEGTICSNTECAFHLTHSLPLGAGLADINDCLVTNAEITVKGEDGQTWTGQSQEPGVYIVQVGQLAATSRYQVQITWEGHTYASQPQSPLPTAAIEKLEWQQTRADQQVDILISTTASDQSENYYRWNYDEWWEVRTPLATVLDYDPTTDEIVPAARQLNRGWCHAPKHKPIVAINTDYANGHIEGYRLYTLKHDEDRFCHRYCTRVTQTAITREEYEYEQLSAKLSDEMGGLFTPLPSALPTNLHCLSDESIPVIGYVGVSLDQQTCDLYIDGKDVGYVSHHLVSYANQDKNTWAEMYKLGYRVYQYFPEASPPVTWVAQWCVDCTAPLWGASLERPDFWQD